MHVSAVVNVAAHPVSPVELVEVFDRRRVLANTMPPTRHPGGCGDGFGVRGKRTANVLLSPVEKLPAPVASITSLNSTNCLDSSVACLLLGNPNDCFGS
jgi:hypothetical protein